MLRCEHCGGLLREQWDYCGRCGADVPESITTESAAERSLSERLARLRVELPAAISGGTTRLRAALSRLRVPRPALSGSHVGAAAGRVATELRRAPSITPRLGAPRVTAPRVSLPQTGPGLRAAGASLPVVGLVAALGLGLFFIGGSAMQARSELGTVREEQTHASLEVERLNGELATAEASIAELTAELQRARAELEGAGTELASLEQRAAGSEEERAELTAALDELRQTLEETEATLAEREQRIADQQLGIAALRECLQGMDVALMFARDGQRRHAERAFEVIEDACAEARAFQ